VGSTDELYGNVDGGRATIRAASAPSSPSNRFASAASTLSDSSVHSPPRNRAATDPITSFTNSDMSNQLDVTEEVISNSGSDESLIILEEENIFILEKENDISPYNKYDVTWEITSTNSDGSIIAKAIYPTEAALLWSSRTFHDSRLVSQWVKNTF